MTFEATVVDDDGVVVVASPEALKKRYANRGYDYAFPKALLEGINANELFAWCTGFEGEHTVSVELVSNEVVPDADKAEEADGFHIVLNDGGLLIVPYSQFTMGCDNGGRFQVRDGLVAIAPVVAGSYRVRVTRIAANGAGCSFRVLLTPCPTLPPRRNVENLPGWTTD